MLYITKFITPIVIMVLLFYLIIYISDKFREHKLVKKCSGPKPYPLIGNLNVLLGDMKDITHKIIKLSTIYSSPWLLWVGPKLVVILDDPENIEILSQSSNGYEKSSLYFPIKNLVGNGLFSAPDIKNNKKKVLLEESNTKPTDATDENTTT